MKFSIYSELQWWPGKEPAQVYAEVLEQIDNADRLGFDTYSAIEHFFFPKFSASPDPIALFSAAAQRTSRINFRTLVHVLPYHNPMVLASRIAFADILMGGRYEFGVGRGHGWIPWRAGVAYGEMVERYDESLEILFTALESGGEPFSYYGEVLRHPRRADRPAAAREVPRLHRRHLGQDVHPGRAEGLGRRRPAAPAVRGAARAARPVPLEVRRVRHRARHRLDPRLLPRRGPRHRDARGARPGSRASSPATRRRWSSTRSRRPTS